MKNILEYKGYHTKIEVDLEAGILYGKIEGIRDLVNFESENLESLEEEFHLAVDDYLEFCEEIGKVPEKEYKGTFNVRITPELHRAVSLLAFKNNESLNQTVEKAIQAFVNGTTQTEITLNQTINVSAQELSGARYANTNTSPILTHTKIPAFQGLKLDYSS